jgi:hypothetical protein
MSERRDARYPAEKEKVVKRLFVIVTVTAVACCFPPQPRAATFYLKDGGEIECQSYWQKNGRVYVRINQETVVDFAPDETDPVQNRQPAVMEQKTGSQREEKRPAAPQAAVATSARAESKSPSAAAKPTPVAANTAVAAVPEQTGLSDLRKLLVAVYDRYHQAALAGEFDEQLKWVTAKRQGKMQAVMDNIPENKKAEMKELMKEMTARSYIVTGMQVTSGGRRAVLTLEGRGSFMGIDSLSDGTVDFLKEGSEWKVDKVEWNSRG